MNQPDRPLRPRLLFYRDARFQAVIDDAIRLCYEAERIAREYADRRWGKAVAS